MSSKLKRHQKWNVTKTEMLPNFKMSSKLKSKSKSRRLALITLVLFWGKLLRYKNYQHKKIYLLSVNFDRVTAIFGNLFSLFFLQFFCNFLQFLAHFRNQTALKFWGKLRRYKTYPQRNVSSCVWTLTELPQFFGTFC